MWNEREKDRQPHVTCFEFKELTRIMENSFSFHSITVRLKHDLWRSIESKLITTLELCTIILKCFEAREHDFDRTRKCDRINDIH